MEPCFAKEGKKCRATNINFCVPSVCPFYKTQTQFKQDRRNVLLRIASLPNVIRDYISETYYNDKTPWVYVKEDL